MSVISDGGQIVPDELTFTFELDASLSEFSRTLYEDFAEFGIYDDTTPGATRFIPAHRIYTIEIEEVT
ncbi:hypothetical protein [Streptomyces noursei]|uniref:hypothetical protein n=1 Tax=Streptomyces noursei TaxID=1971 RepID=UPI00167AA19B|nr:hypothetical protein [Streptomyces noursei]MCZ1015589.1 hypothetical protein [Streptomyces noursei]